VCDHETIIGTSCIGNLIEDLVLHAELVNSILLQDIDLEQFEVDEMWTFIKKNKRTLSQEALIQISKVMPGYSLS
jgi:hypothetical protein